MGLTRIKTNSYTSFIQPQLNGLVTLVIDVWIEWMKEGSYINIPGGGIYKVESIQGFTFDLRLETSVIQPGEVVEVDIMYPVNRGEDGISTTWGGANGKEW